MHHRPEVTSRKTLPSALPTVRTLRQLESANCVKLTMLPSDKPLLLRRWISVPEPSFTSDTTAPEEPNRDVTRTDPSLGLTIRVTTGSRNVYVSMIPFRRTWVTIVSRERPYTSVTFDCCARSVRKSPKETYFLV